MTGGSSANFPVFETIEATTVRFSSPWKLDCPTLRRMLDSKQLLLGLLRNPNFYRIPCNVR